MAFPVVESVSTWGTGAPGTSHGPISLPSGIQAGDLLLCLFSSDGSPTITASSGWDKLGQAQYSGQVAGAVFTRTATGDAADTLTVTTSATEIGAAIVYRISGAAQSGVSGSAAFGGSNSTIDAPAYTLPDGATDALWVYFHAGNYTQITSTPPSGYTNLTTELVSVSGSASASSAYRTATVATEDPSACSATTGNYWTAWTIAVAPPVNQGRILLDGPLGAPALHVAIGDPALSIETPGPLGVTAAQMRADPAAVLALHGPLLSVPSASVRAEPVAVLSTSGLPGTPQCVGRIPAFGWMATSGPLGRRAFARLRLGPVALIALAGPLGTPRLRARHRAPVTAHLSLAGPLGRPRLLMQQRFMQTLTELPALGDGGRQRLLSDPLPLRRSTVFDEYRVDTLLPWVYGRATLAPVPLDADGLEYLIADHAIVAVDAVKDDGQPIDGWELVQTVDATGEAVALLYLSQPPEGALSVALTGRRHPQTGALLEHPADIAEDLLTACGWSVPVGAFDVLRDRYPSVALGGVLQESITIREAVSRVLGSVDADWCGSPLSAWLPEPGEPLATLTPRNSDAIAAEATHADLCTRLRVAYGYDWAAGAPRGSMTIEATDRLEHLGAIEQDLDLPWVRTARDALMLATAVLSRRARSRWEFSITLALTERYRPGDTLAIDDPWVPSGPALVTAVERGRTGQTLIAHRYADDPPRIEMIGRGRLIDAAGADQIRVDYKDGVATFTILNERGEPLAGASVTLDGTETRTTDRAGQVQFVTERGLHTLLVTANGYAPLEMEVVI